MSSARRFDVLALGEPLLEFNQLPGEGAQPLYRRGYGGDTSNCIISAARQGARTAYVTRVGKDAFGEMLLQLWQREGVNTEGVAVDEDGRTGIYFVSHTADGHAFSYARAGSAASRMRPEDLPLALIREARFLHVSGISQAISLSACDTVFAALDHARRNGVALSYDPNLRLKLWPLMRARAIVSATVPYADYFLPSLEDASALSGLTERAALLAWCLALGAPHVVLKCGADGVIAASRGRSEFIPGHRLASVDATGAGDCFDGALLARLAQGEDFFRAARYANAAAALTTAGYGAVEPIPKPESVAALLAARD